MLHYASKTSCELWENLGERSGVAFICIQSNHCSVLLNIVGDVVKGVTGGFISLDPFGQKIRIFLNIFRCWDYLALNTLQTGFGIQATLLVLSALFDVRGEVKMITGLFIPYSQ